MQTILPCIQAIFQDLPFSHHCRFIEVAKKVLEVSPDELNGLLTES